MNAIAFTRRCALLRASKDVPQNHPSRLAEEARTSSDNGRALRRDDDFSRGPSALISKTREINFENVALVAVRHVEFRKASRNPFMAV
jgi:hypothetical protein